MLASLVRMAQVAKAYVVSVVVARCTTMRSIATGVNKEELMMMMMMMNDDEAKAMMTIDDMKQ